MGIMLVAQSCSAPSATIGQRGDAAEPRRCEHDWASKVQVDEANAAIREV